MTQRPQDESGFLSGVRVLEVADELGEYCGKVLAGLGADVIKVEPPDGEKTRSYGPFYGDTPSLDRSLYFWHYNFGKRSLVLDLDADRDRTRFTKLAKRSDVIIDTRPRGYMDERGLGYEALHSINPRIVVARISPFGDSGPWADFAGSDLVHLALGGVMMNCGYDPEPSGRYDTAPVAPQMWQSYHIAGEMTVIGLLAALRHRHVTGRGQLISTSVHEAVAQQTETDLPDWIYARIPHARMTCRHSLPEYGNTRMIASTKDGRWWLPYRSYLGTARDPGGDFDRIVTLLSNYGSAEDLHEVQYESPEYRARTWVNLHIGDVIGRFVARFQFHKDMWREFQAAGLAWAPLRRPAENLPDAHWASRETFVAVEHPELGRAFREVGAKWYCAEVPWRKGPRAPLLGEHNAELLSEPGLVEDRAVADALSDREEAPMRKRSRQFALSGVRCLDLSWLLASGGAGRFLSCFGADVIKVEHRSRWDMIRWGVAMVQPGGRDERDRATAPLRGPRPASPNRSGFFMDINAGKRAISLNLAHPRGKDLLRQLVQSSDVLIEGFSPGTLDRLGFGYETLRKLNPAIIYAQQSGMGQHGSYGRMRSYGPVAQAFSGLSEMSGLPEPYPPAGIGYSYLDWFGAYNLAIAILAALHRRDETGEGCWIDSSQVEAGIYLTGTAVLDFDANGRDWRRYGNRSPYRKAAPHGAYRTVGQDRWIAISVFTEDQWVSLGNTLGHPEWVNDPRFLDLRRRLEHEDALDAVVESATLERADYELMTALQAAGVPAGVCQTAQDRYELDPQLRHLQWLTELRQSELGTWPVKEFPVKLRESPAHMGGPVDRHGPSYGEDNDYVYRQILGLTSSEIRSLEEQDVI